MERSRAANVFADCVAKRWRYDIILKPVLLWSILLVPFLFGLLGAFDALVTDPSKFGIQSEVELDSLLEEGIFLSLILEIAVISFLIFYINRVNNNHLVRDSMWMGSLIEYVDEHGADSTELRDLLARKMRKEGNKSRFISMASCGCIILTLAVYGVYIQKADMAFLVQTMDINVRMVRILGLLIIIQALATFSRVFALASKHEAHQIRFTEELKRQCATFGLEIPAMRRGFKRHRPWYLRVLFTILTLGLYVIYVLFNSCTRMNKHLMNQWMYEDELLDRIMEFEGGIGLAIRKNDSDTPPRDVVLELLRTV